MKNYVFRSSEDYSTSHRVLLDIISPFDVEPDITTLNPIVGRINVPRDRVALIRTTCPKTRTRRPIRAVGRVTRRPLNYYD